MPIRQTAVLSTLLAAVMPLGLAAQTWVDRGEYDLALEVRRKTEPKDRIAALEQWKAKYPASALKEQRAELFIAGYNSLGQTAEIMEVAREMVKTSPDSFVGSYWIAALAPTTANPSAALLGEFESAAKRILSAPDSLFPTAALAAEKKRTLALAHRTLGWVEWKRGNTGAAREHMIASLTIDPQDAEASAWLGTMLVPDQSPAKRTESIWALARAAYMDGEGSLTGVKRREVRGLLEAAYAGYHGSLDGLDQIGAASRRSATMPDGFKIESAAEAAVRIKEEEFLRAHPELQEWMKIWKQLVAASPEQAAQQIAGLTLGRMTGTVLGCVNTAKPPTVSVSVTGEVPEVVLELDVPMVKCPASGAIVEFEGTPTAFTKSADAPPVLIVSTKRSGVTVKPAIPVQR